DVVIVVGFRRRPHSFGQLMQSLSASPAQIILLTDNSGRRYDQAADHLIVCPVDSVTAFDSYASAFSVVSVLAAAVLSHNLPAGRARIAAIGRSYDGLDELETPLR
ncbi:MAG TPA: MurR/RpiR family transcriptional regulator, partial [Glaciihabitans sp.]|nr:MurR/RpiR family transcriptional regulator [Glaciihabitans sp.]